MDRQFHLKIGVLFGLCWFLLVTLPHLAPFAYAQSTQRPFWTEQAMFRLGTELFLVGRSSCAKTVEDGREEAFQRGLNELLNLAQISSARGLTVETQMLFHERDTEGCPKGTVTVWRLLRVDAEKVVALQGKRKNLAAAKANQVGNQSRRHTLVEGLRIGMPSYEVVLRLGKPETASIRADDNRFAMEYPWLGLTLFLDKDDLVTGWKWKGPQRDSSPPSQETGARNQDMQSGLETRGGTLTGGVVILPNADKFISLPSTDSKPPENLPAPILSSSPFPTRTLTVPGLAFRTYSNGLRVSDTMRCDVGHYDLSIWRLATAAGPEIFVDNQFTDSTEDTLRRAVMAAAQGIRYDPRFIGVQLSGWHPQGFPIAHAHESITIIPTGAEVAWALSLASAILNDRRRHDIITVGHLNAHLAVQPVIELEDLEAQSQFCHQGFVELLVPEGQAPPRWTGVTHKEIRSLAEAYQLTRREESWP